MITPRGTIRWHEPAIHDNAPDRQRRRGRKMKKLIVIVLALCFLMVPTSSYAGEKQVTFAWEQSVSTDLAGWKLYRSDYSGELYHEVLDIQYSKNDSGTYTSDYEMTSPDGETHTYYFELRAYDSDGNPSDPSNEVSLVVDFEAPSAPFNLTVTIISK